MDIRRVRTELAGAVAAGGYVAYDVVPDSGQVDAGVPFVVVQPPSSVRYHQTHGNVVEADFIITVATGRQDDAHAQELLDEAMTWPGVAQLLEQHTTDAWRGRPAVLESRDVRSITVGASTQCLAFDVVITVRK